MNERDWSEAEHPGLLLTHIQNAIRAPRTKSGRRKLRLVGCGYCRLIWSFIRNTQAKHAVEVAERLADDSATKAEVEKAKTALVPATMGGYQPTDASAQARTAACLAANTLATQALVAAEGALLLPLPLAGYHGNGNEAYALMCDLLRDIFGNPFRPIAFSPSWRTDTAVSLASGMYDSRDFGAMPILADALQDAGCDNDDILNHCRDPEHVHVRGCWVVDSVLGKG